MAIGFTPKYSEDFALNELSKEQFLVVANNTLKDLEWTLSYMSEYGLIAYTDSSMFSNNAEIRIQIDNGIATLKSTSIGTEMIDLGRNKRNIKEFIRQFEKIKDTFSANDIELKYQELNKNVFSIGEDLLNTAPQTTTEGITSIFSIFIPKPGYFVTPILINLNILIFILMTITGVDILTPDSESLLNWGANFRPVTLEGQWWRLLTCCFLHIGIIHLLMNMYALLYIGVLLEPLLGKGKFIAAYLLTGIAASTASLWWHDLTISAGASGAIFGMYGVFLALLTTSLIEKTARQALLTSIGVFVGYNLLNGMSAGIDNAAHIGGLVSGFIIGYAFINSLKKPDDKKASQTIIALLTIIILATTYIVGKSIPNDIGKYESKMKEFAALETTALEVFNLPPSTPTNEVLKSIKEAGIKNWEKAIKLLNEVNQLDLPQDYHSRNDALKKYCDLRIKCYELLYRSVDADTHNFDKQIEDYNKQIEVIINSLVGKQK